MTRPGGPTAPPRLARWFLERALPADLRDDIVGDLEEVFARKVGDHGPARARLWYAYEAVVVPTRLALARRGTGRSRRSAGISWLDVKLGVRMLARYPGLTLVAGFTLAVGIPVGMYPFHLMSALDAPLPFEGSERVVVLRYADEVSSRRRPVPFEQFTRWRERLTTVDALAATTIGLSYNVISEDGGAAPVRGAEVTPSLFAILPVAPLLGRTLVPADEAPGAPEVVVISQDLWESRLGGDPTVVGRDIQVGGVPHMVVGVMPEGFLFPIRDHLWKPLRVGASEDRTAGSFAVVLGRLAEGASREQVEAEALTLDLPDTMDRSTAEPRPLRAEVVRLPVGLLNGMKGGMSGNPELYLIQAITLLVLVVACANVGMLIFARTVARSSELAVRTALGASRRRVIGQLFTESLVLAVLAAGAGLLVGDRVILPFVQRFMPPGLPYWLDFGVTPRTVAAAMALAVLSAGVVGVIPALRATGRAVRQNIQRAESGMRGLRFGGLAGGLIVLDAALAVATVAFAIAYSSGFSAVSGDDGAPDGAFLSAELTVPRPAGVAAEFDEAAYRAHVARTQEELLRRLRSEEAVRGVAMADVLPGMDHHRSAIEVDDDPAGASTRHRTGTAHVAPGFFGVFDRTVLAGRAFTLADTDDGNPVVIVNTDFVDNVLGGRNALGRRVRYVPRGDDEPGPWLEIVGVVGRLGTVGLNTDPLRHEAMYRPLAPGVLSTVRLALHVPGEVEAFTPRLRAIAGEVDPAAIVADPRPLADVLSYTLLGHALVMTFSGLLVGVLVALSASGIYALMSFTITQRKREIGVRVALGAARNRIVAIVAKRALAQLGAGIVLGMPFAAWLLSMWDEIGQLGPRSANDSAVVPVAVLTLVVASATMAAIAAVACTGPTLRALRIEPTEALRG